MSLLYLTKRIEFSSSHFYFNSRWNQDENVRRFGKETNTHGHNYLLELSLEGEVDSITGMVINTVELKEKVVQLLNEFDHKHLNLDTPYFQNKLPTVENIARTLGEHFQLQNKGLNLSRIRLYENEDSFSDCFVSQKGTPMEKKLFLTTKTYRFSSAHRLHSKQLSDQENQRIYGKCNNPNSHGHNYVLEVTLKGTFDPAGGVIDDPESPDHHIQKEVVERYDHHFLDQDFEEFKDKVSTAENILVIIWNRLTPFLSNRLYKLKLIETRDNYFEYYG
ncbi:MAG: 6-carboxytetrahydropterin synthase [Nitrospirae bacterium]|nr:6-carboxytetrahydropterin synthase [Nitrospirota bacterium]MBI3352246.1 6-carboxytetrahydropterin synthase [Nitrospirota bacterium]